eukprot:TRINITY_DN67133_c0_g1_i1.p1 TRINITY_DN67133_c0_g1~~TRINITY_DN67133_c0_g1_i1.p1  ORF type:complete len:288 (+),score=61.32 TRINITY_DN67133_c0_g1_i1:1-864(+)
MNAGICIIFGDPGEDRPLGDTDELLSSASDLGAEPGGFWTLTHHLNRLYARLHGYRFRRPEVSNLELKRMLDDGEWPPRRVQWAIVRLIERELKDPSCNFVVWLDSDAYVVSTEPLEALLSEQGLLEAGRSSAASSRLFLFASAASHGSPTLNISDHFMVVRNTPRSRELMRHWWRLPQQNESLHRFRQDLFLEQTVMNELFPYLRAESAPPLPLRQFEGFSGSFVRHSGGIKDMALVASLRAALLARLESPRSHPQSRWAEAVRNDTLAQRWLARRSSDSIPGAQG